MIPKLIGKPFRLEKGKYVAEGQLEKDELGQTFTRYRIIKNGVAVSGWKKPGKFISKNDLETAIDDYKRLME
jgi:hypothetical protein